MSEQQFADAVQTMTHYRTMEQDAVTWENYTKANLYSNMRMGYLRCISDMFGNKERKRLIEATDPDAHAKT